MQEIPAFIDPDRLAHALAIQEQSYRLLRWVADRVQTGAYPARRHHGFALEEAATAWVTDCYDLLPEGLRPRRENLREFALFFSTYLSTSFTFDPAPPHYRIPWGGCDCPMCGYLARAPSLNVKRLIKRDKYQAINLKIEHVSELAEQLGKPLSSQQAEMIATGKPTRREAALATYAHWLVLRLEGLSPGEPLLVLWREFAWNQHGAPIKGFRLRLEDCVSAERELLNAIDTASA